MYIRCCLLLLSLTLLAAPHAIGEVKTPKTQSKVKLIFSVDQGFGNGIVVNDDTLAVGRIIEALQPLRKRYDVYLLLNPMIADHGKFNHILSAIAAKHMPFMLDVYTSDAEMLGTISKQNAPYDGAHGITISLDSLRAYRAKYGKLFSGLRFMEVFGQDFTVRAIKTTNPEWAHPGIKIPKDDFFQPQQAEEFIRFAKQNNMFVQFSDWHWIEFADWDKPQIKNEAELSSILHKYPGVVTVTYANNEPNEDSVKRIGYWQKSVKKFAADGAAGYGLSDQSWLRSSETNCPVADIIKWAGSALEQRCGMIEFEPVWYFFTLPVGSFAVQQYTSDPMWRDRGYATHNMKQLINALLKPHA